MLSAGDHVAAAVFAVGYVVVLAIGAGLMCYLFAPRSWFYVSAKVEAEAVLADRIMAGEAGAQEEHLQMEDCLTEFRYPEGPELEPGVTSFVRRTGIERKVAKSLSVQFCAAVAMQIKKDIGLPKPTEANRLVVTKIIAKAFDRINLRHVDCVVMMPKVRAMVFSPTQADVEEQQYYASAKVRRNLQRMRATWEGDEAAVWRRLLGVFGRIATPGDQNGLKFSA